MPLLKARRLAVHNPTKNPIATITPYQVMVNGPSWKAIGCTKDLSCPKPLAGSNIVSSFRLLPAWSRDRDGPEVGREAVAPEARESLGATIKVVARMWTPDFSRTAAPKASYVPSVRHFLGIAAVPRDSSRQISETSEGTERAAKVLTHQKCAAFDQFGNVQARTKS